MLTRPILRNQEEKDEMKFASGIYFLAAGLVSGRAVASLGGEDILAGEHFRMAVLAPRQATPTNLQVFSGSIGGVRASAITNTGDPDRPFGVDGDTFVCSYSG